MFVYFSPKTIALLLCYLMVSSRAWSAEAVSETAASPAPEHQYVQDFTADTLRPLQLKLGLQSAVGVGLDTQIGMDLVALGVGVPNLTVKSKVWERGDHEIALGLGLFYLDAQTALWGGANSLFDELSLQVIRPQINWTHRLSRRLFLHTYWSIGAGPIDARLSDRGKRRLWNSKYPSGDYETRTKDSNSTATNIDQNNTVSHRTLQVQSLLGLSRDLFQVSGEYVRDTTKKVIITSRIDRTEFADLSARGLRLTMAQEWRFNSFHMRIGLGLTYQVVSGTDLDDEQVDDAGLSPIADLDFYWLI